MTTEERHTAVVREPDPRFAPAPRDNGPGR